MILRAFLALILYIGVLTQAAIPVYAQENLILGPEEQITTENSQEVPADETLSISSSTPKEAFSEEDEPELVWGCVMEYQNGSDEETERCGLGYYRTICFGGADGEECITFFEFSEEPEIPEDPMVQRIVSLREKKYLDLSIDLNGIPLTDQASHTIPSAASNTLTLSYQVTPPEDFFMNGSPGLTFIDAFAAATLTFQVYRGSIGSAVLVHEEALPHGVTSTLSAPPLSEGSYIFLVSANYPEGQPGYSCHGGDLCPTYRSRIDSLTWFMKHGTAFYDDLEDASDRENRYRDESFAQRSRISEYLPVALGMIEVTIGEPEPVSGVSNVLFLPGIKGSRLYKPSDTCDPDLSLSCPSVKLWEPSGDSLLRDLFLTSSGESARSDVYVEEGDILATALGANFYASFVNQMNSLKDEGTITDWKPVAYDWRLSLDDIVTNGVKRGTKVYFQEETDTPYIEKTLRELAETSPTGKVSIVAHSNGGLVAKRLMQKLEQEGAADLVDKIIFVGVPQSGATQAMAGLLYGYGEALPFDACADNFFLGQLCSLLGSRAIARELAEHSPMAYHLLPSQAYFSQVQDAEHPIAKFSGTEGYTEERTSYGPEITSADEMYRFLTAEDGGRTKPAIEDTKNANVLSSEFLSYARSIHESIDTWTPPSNVQVFQIAGWGVNTVAGVEFYEQRNIFGGYKELYRPIFVEDGDGVVPVPSALQMSQSLENVQEFWVNLRESSRGPAVDRNHGDILELNEVRIILRDILTSKLAQLPQFISEDLLASEEGTKLIFFLHSPLTLELYDLDGNHVGENLVGGFDENIPDIEYGEFGDVKYIIAPVDNYEVVLHGKASGTFSLDVQRVDGNKIISTMTVADVPTTASTVATLNVSEDGIAPLLVDMDGDGINDSSITLKDGETVFYQATTDPTFEHSSSGSSHKSQTRSEDEVAHKVINNIPFVEASMQEITKDELLVGDVLGAAVSPEESESITKPDPMTYADSGTNFFSWISKLLYTWWERLSNTIGKYLTYQIYEN